MKILFKVINQFPASRSALKSVHLVENSLTMQAIQKEKLLPASQMGAWELLWHDSIGDVPQNTAEYTMLVAHEFFDALPIHVLEVTFITHTFIRFIQMLFQTLENPTGLA